MFLRSLKKMVDFSQSFWSYKSNPEREKFFLKTENRIIIQEGREKLTILFVRIGLKRG